jgi:hypothetical protein
MPEQPLTYSQAREATADHNKIAKLIAVPPQHWAGNCHAVSLAVLRSGVVGPGRIARGWASGIHSQHSWIVLGDDCYDPEAVIVDPTYWLATSQMMHHTILVDYAFDLDHTPHGSGSIFASGEPAAGDGPVIELTPKTPLSALARAFLDLIGPLDRKGWMQLANSPVGDWPAGEIIAAMDDTPELRAMAPIDILGMVTDRNPSGYYR